MGYLNRMELQNAMTIDGQPFDMDRSAQIGRTVHPLLKNEFFFSHHQASLKGLKGYWCHNWTRNFFNNNNESETFSSASLSSLVFILQARSSRGCSRRTMNGVQDWRTHDPPRIICIEVGAWPGRHEAYPGAVPRSHPHKSNTPLLQALDPSHRFPSPLGSSRD